MQLISRIPALSQLDLVGCGLTGQQMGELVDVLQRHVPCLEQFSFTHNGPIAFPWERFCSF